PARRLPERALLLLVHDLVVRLDHLFLVAPGPRLGGPTRAGVRAGPGGSTRGLGLALVHLLAGRAERLHQLVPRRVQDRGVVALERFLRLVERGLEAVPGPLGNLVSPLPG